MGIKEDITGSSHWLAKTGLLDISLVEQAWQNAQALDQPLVTYLVSHGLLDPVLIANTAARHFGLPLLDLDAIDSATLPGALVKPELLKRHRLLPLHLMGKKLLLGMSDPAMESSLNEIKFQTDCSLIPVIIEEDKLSLVLQDYLEQSQQQAIQGNALSQQDFDTIQADGLEENPNASDRNPAIDETPVMRLVNKMLADAIVHRASDIHIENYEHCARIRFREDGMLREIAKPPKKIASKIISRLKIMARLDIAEKRRPQDGRFKLRLTRSRDRDFRVSTLPTLWGEKTVLRVLDPGPDCLDLDTLGFTKTQQSHYIQALEKRQGLILVTGPTGSGKSFSMYAGLAHLNTRERNIATIEDPVEIQMEGINQVAVNTQIGLDFPEALRAFLRQDPDVLMVGEIRDTETAAIAVRAAQTGHLVMSTLHTNSAAQTLSRLLDMGIAPYHLATSLSLVIAQRLLRRLCNACKIPLQLPPKVLIQEGFSPESVGSARLFSPAGCRKCHCGYRGRIGIYETVAITDAISRVIIEGGNSMQIADITGKAGFNSLRDSALEKAAQGLTSLAEVNRMT